MTGRLRVPAWAAIEVDDPTTLPRLPGFAGSAFSPLVWAVSDEVLDAEAVTVRGSGAATAIVLASIHGDATTADLAAERVASRRLPDPMLFHQSVPTPILGMIQRQWSITGPVTCLAGDAAGAHALATADLLLLDEEIAQVLVVAAEVAATARTEALGRPGPLAPPPAATAVALLVDHRPAQRGEGVLAVTPQPPTGRLGGPVPYLRALCTRLEAARTGRRTTVPVPGPG